jgi:hypothetical protein
MFRVFVGVRCAQPNLRGRVDVMRGHDVGFCRLG